MMKPPLLLLFFFLIHAASSRTSTPLLENWRFAQTPDDAPWDDCDDANAALAAAACGPARPDFDDSVWRKLRIPHDFIVEAPFVESDSTLQKNLGYKELGKAWYRLRFSLPTASFASSSAVWIDFDGVQANSTVFVNGKRLGKHASGYTSFRFALDPNFLQAEDNILAVHVDATQPDSWWYDGGGIYRKVHLVMADPLHIVPSGLYLPTKVKEGTIKKVGDKNDNLIADATLSVHATITNQGPTARSFRLYVNFTGPVSGGSPTYTQIHTHSSSSTSFQLAPGATETFSLPPIDLSGVSLWSLGHPHLYRVNVDVNSDDDDKAIDTLSETIGIRSLRFDPDQGFFLNDQPTKIQGMCNHQDFAGTGVAMPDSLQTYRVHKLKTMGANAWRTSHNPPNAELLAETDRMGMLVWDENHRNRDQGPWLEDLRALILRDRNRPSVIIWSLCNEILCEEFNATSAATLKAEIQSLDPEGGRPVSAAVNDMFYREDFHRQMDVFSFNYNINRYETWHKNFPHQPIMASETSSAVSDRGVYATNETLGYVSAYDVNYPPWGASAEDAWCPIGANDYMAGSFIWTGFDYRGEPTPYKWPNINSHFAAGFDMCGFEKDLFYYYQSVWLQPQTNHPMVHLVPSHWNWGEDDKTHCKGHCRVSLRKKLRRRRKRRALASDDSKEGGGGEGGDKWEGGEEEWVEEEEREIEVWAFSNGEAVELFLNGRSLGPPQAMPREPSSSSSKSIPAADGSVSVTPTGDVDGGGGGGGYKCRHVMWKVPFTPGTLEARATDAKGALWATDRIVTTGTPTALELVIDWPLPPQQALKADADAVALIDVRVVDSEGRVVNTASRIMVEFDLARVSGGGDGGVGSGGEEEDRAFIRGVGNGDPSCHENDTFLHLDGGEGTKASRSVFNGHARVIVQAGHVEEELVLTATAVNSGSGGSSLSLAPGRINLSVKEEGNMEEQEVAAAVERKGRW